MEQRIFHGKLTPSGVAQALVAEFNRGNLVAQSLGIPQDMVVQIASRQRRASGGQTSLTVSIKEAPDGVSIGIGQQAWLGVVASLGQTALSVWRNPWNLIGRLDDLAQDIEHLQLADQVWGVIERTARSAGASFELSEILRRLECEYCSVANPVGEASCVACGAPLGRVQPRTCRSCGFVVRAAETACPNCRRPLR
jgi:hypothetical protein